MMYDDIDWDGIKSRVKTKTSTYFGGVNKSDKVLDQKDELYLKEYVRQIFRDLIKEDPKKYCEEYKGNIKLKYNTVKDFNNMTSAFNEIVFLKTGVRRYDRIYGNGSSIIIEPLLSEIKDKVKREKLGKYTVQDYLDEFNLKNYYIQFGRGSMIKKNHHAEIVSSIYIKEIRWGAFIINTARTYKAFEIYRGSLCEKSIVTIYKQIESMKKVKPVKYKNSKKLKKLMKKEMARYM